MPTHNGLKAAVEQDIINTDQADRLSAFLASRGDENPFDTPGSALTKSEGIRFVYGLHDIFMTAGVVLLVTGLSYFGAALTVLIQSIEFNPEIVLAATLLILGVGVIALGAGEHPNGAYAFRNAPIAERLCREIPPVTAHV